MSTGSGRRPKVVLTTEGTYPHVVGGVSTWCHQLIEAQPDVDFEIFSLTTSPYVAARYTLPANATLHTCPIWGVEEPAEFNNEMSPREAIIKAAATREDLTREGFLPLLEPMMRMLARPETIDPRRFGELLYGMHVYFRTHDYRSTWRTRVVWECARNALLEAAGEVPEQRRPEVGPDANPNGHEVVRRIEDLLHTRVVGSLGHEDMTGEVRLPRLFDASEGIRVLYRLLTPVNYDYPEGDVVHASAAAYCAIPGIIAKIERGTPFMITEHGVWMREQMLFLGRIGYPFHLRKFLTSVGTAMSRTAYYYADQISPVCSYNARWEAKNGATAEQIEVIYNGVDEHRFTPAVVERPAAPTVVLVSRVDPLKDIETSLRVAAKVRESLPDVRFLHYGPAVDAEYERTCLDLHAELALAQTFTFEGATKDTPGAYNRGDLVLLTSISEAFPYTVIEAMMCGKPVVATRVGGVPEAVADLGETARIRDVEGLAAGVVRLLMLPEQERVALAQACRERALENFTQDRSIARYASSYDRLRALEHAPLLVELPTAPLEPMVPVALPVQQPQPIAPTRSLPAPAAQPVRLPQPAPVQVQGPVQTPVLIPVRTPAARVGLDRPRPAAAGFAAPASADELRALLRHPAPAARVAALGSAAARLTLAEAVHVLSLALRSDPSPTVRVAAGTQLDLLLDEQVSA